MQKFLFIILGFLGMIFLIELGVFFWQKNTPSPLVVIPSTSTSPPIFLPRSSQDKKEVRFVKLSESYIKLGYVGWQDNDFFYMAKKDNKELVSPFSFMGIIRKIENKQMDIEFKDANNTAHSVPAQLALGNKVINRTKDISAKLKTGSKVRVTLDTNLKNNSYLTINIVYLL